MFHRQFRTVALVTLILSEIRRAIESSGRALHGALHIGRPVRFVGDDDANAIAMARMEEACRHAGFTDFTFYPEPVAASLSYLHTQQRAAAGPERRGLLAAAGAYLREPQLLLTFDFGGGYPGPVPAGKQRRPIPGARHGGPAARRQPESIN